MDVGFMSDEVDRTYAMEVRKPPGDVVDAREAMEAVVEATSESWYLFAKRRMGWLTGRGGAVYRGWWVSVAMVDAKRLVTFPVDDAAADLETYAAAAACGKVFGVSGTAIATGTLDFCRASLSTSGGGCSGGGAGNSLDGGAGEEVARARSLVFWMCPYWPVRR